jgi:hypothetical protein
MTNDIAGVTPTAAGGKEPWIEPVIEVFPITEAEGHAPDPTSEDGAASIS